LSDDELELHKKMAGQLFNRTWDLMDKGEERTPEEDEEMVHAAHASRYHWVVVINSGKYSDTGLVNHARGDWQISRAYSLLKRYESALYYAKKSLDMCLNNKIGDFDLAFGYEAVARAYSLVETEKEYFKKYLAKANEAAENIEKDDDKSYFLSELKSISA